MIKVVILGATGGCADILDLIHQINRHAATPLYDCVGFLDDNPDVQGKSILGKPVLGGFASYQDYLKDCLFATAIGSPYNFWKKESILQKLEIAREQYVTLVHPSANFSPSSEVGYGCVIHANAVICRDVVLGDHVLVLPNSVISHGSKVGSFTTINACVSISGDVLIEKAVYCGANSSIRQNVTIGSCSQIGMGSVVIEDVPEKQVVVGVPAKPLKTIEV